MHISDHFILFCKIFFQKLEFDNGVTKIGKGVTKISILVTSAPYTLSKVLFPSLKSVLFSCLKFVSENLCPGCRGQTTVSSPFENQSLIRDWRAEINVVLSFFINFGEESFPASRHSMKHEGILHIFDQFLDNSENLVNNVDFNLMCNCVSVISECKIIDSFENKMD
jgi:hypothetical protein